jgi:hypothetical protein
MTETGPIGTLQRRVRELDARLDALEQSDTVRPMLSDADKAAFVQQVYEGVVQELVQRTPTAAAELGQVRDDLSDIAGKLEQRLFRLETQVQATDRASLNIGPLLTALRGDKRAAQGLVLWAKRTQGGTRGALVEIVEALIGL